MRNVAVRSLAVASAAAALVSLAACRGSNRGALPAMTGGLASFSITTPYDAVTGPQTKSIRVEVSSINGVAPASSVQPVVLNVSRTASGCALVQSDTLGCTIKVPVPAGNDGFVISSFAQANAAGAATSVDRVTTRISAGHSTACVKKTPAPKQ